MHTRSALLALLAGASLIGIDALLPALAADAEEITVTARRRSETLQEVPLAVTAIGSEQIENRGITSISQIVALDPSIVIDQGFNAEDTRIAVRGLTNSRGRSNVAFLVDGVDVTSESTGTAGSSLLVNQRLLGDVERIELIKGPQSALYGRSAFAGAISYVTKNANLDSFEGSFGFEAAEYSQFQYSGSASGPIIPGKLGARVQAVSWSGDSPYDNAASGRNLGKNEGWGTALTVNWLPSDTTDLKWRISYSDDRSAPQPQTPFRGDDLEMVPLPPQAFVSNGGPVADGTEVFSIRSFGDAGDRQVFYSEDPLTGEEYEGSHTELLRSSLQFNWQVGQGTFTSTTGFTDAEFTINQDIDYQAIGFPDMLPNNWESDSLNKTRQLSQEFRYATDFDGAWNFTGGLLGWKEERDVLDRNYIAVCDIPVPQCDGGWQPVVIAEDIQYGDAGFTFADTTHWSIYGLVEWDITDRLTLSAEARYVNELFDLARTQGTVCLISPFRGCTPLDSPEVGAFRRTVRSSYVTPRFLADYTLNDNINLYASIGEGIKPEGISTLPSGGGAVPPENLEFDSEKLWAYEAGWKTTWDGDFGNLVFNGAIFFQDYTDKQVVVNRFDPIFGIVPAAENASAAEVFGQEVQLVYSPPVEGLTFNIAYTHLDTEFTDFVAEITSAQAIAEVGNCELAVDDAGRDVCPG